MKVTIAPCFLPKKLGRPVAVEDLTAIGPAMRLLRKGAGMTQAEMAEVLGIERTSMTNTENGRQVVTLDRLSKLADFVGAELEIRFLPPNLDASA